MKRRQRRLEETLRAYLYHGSSKKAAHELGISESTVRQRLSAYYAELGVSNAAQAAYIHQPPPGWRPAPPEETTA